MAETGENYTTARTALLNGPLYLLVVTTKHGDNLTLYATEQAAKDAVYDFVAEYWESDGPTGEDLPADRDVAVEDYFDESPDESYSIVELNVEGSPAAPAPEPFDITKLDLTKLDDHTLLDIVQKARDEYAKRNELGLVEVLRTVLAEESEVRMEAAIHGEPVRAYFDTMDYENGNFFHWTPTIVYADGTARALECEDLEEALNEVSSDYQPLTGSSSLMVLLNDGTMHVENYGHTITSEPKGNPIRYTGRYVPTQTRVYEVESVLVPDFAWECRECGEMSGLQWDTQEEAGKALAQHVKEHEEAPRPPRTAFYVDESMYTPNGYIPSLVTEGEPGHSPMIGSGELSEPWYWGQDIDTAKRIAAKANADKGLSEQDVEDIIHSSIVASVQQDGRRAAAEERLQQLKRGF